MIISAILCRQFSQNYTLISKIDIYRTWYSYCTNIFFISHNNNNMRQRCLIEEFVIKEKLRSKSEKLKLFVCGERQLFSLGLHLLLLVIL